MRKKTESKKSTNLKTGNFTEKELKLYGLKDKEIEVVLQYQKELPILQEDDKNGVNTRVLCEQLKIKKYYSEWFNNVIEQLELEEGFDYKSTIHFKGNRKNVKTTDHFVNLEIAKEIAMISGVGNRVNKETKDISRITRKYFIYIEKAFKERYEWNVDREDTLIKCKVLRKAIITNKSELDKTRPSYCNNNFIAEFCLLNEVIIGMSAKQYRAIKGLNKSESIRNTFNEKELELVHMLEQYNADLITIQNEYDWNKRKEYLSKKLKAELGISA